MKRIIISLILFFGILFGVGFWITNDAPALLSAYFSSRLKVKVKVRKLDFHPRGITVSNFKIKNPKDSPLPDAFVAKKIAVGAQWVSYFHDPINIDSVEIDDVYVSMLLPKDKKVACNWVKILQNLDEESKVIRKMQRSFTIKKLIVRNLTVALYTPGKKVEMVGPIPIIEIDNINSDKGLPLRTFTKAIVNEMMKKLFSLKLVQTAIAGILKLPFSILEFIFKPLTGSDKGDPCAEIYKPEKPPEEQEAS